MNSSAPSEPSLSLSTLPQGAAEEGAKECLSKDTEIARYLPHLSRMSSRLKQTSTQIESSVVGVCDSFQASVVTLKPAIRGHFKTGHRDWPKT